MLRVSLRNLPSSRSLSCFFSSPKDVSRLSLLCTVNHLNYSQVLSQKRLLSVLNGRTDLLNSELCHFYSKRSMTDSKYPKYKLVKLPSLSPTMESGTITSWDKAVGDQLDDGDIIAQIETDKAVMAMETPFPGYLAKILVPEGTKDIEINEPIAIIVSKADQIKSFNDFSKDDIVLPTKPTSSSPPTSPSDTQPKTKESIFKTDVGSTPSLTPSSDRVIASPYAKKLASESGIDLRNVAFSGPRITSSDVISHSQTSKQLFPTYSASGPTEISQESSPSSISPFTDIELTNMRKTIATRLTESKSTVPHFYLTSRIEMDTIIELRKNFNELLSKKNVKLSLNDFIVKAASKCLAMVPECNSSFMDTFIRQFHDIDINVAVSTDIGLITPFVKNTDRKGLVEISTEIKSLASKARERTLKPEEFQGGTFTISNLGMYGITNFTAIINPPQSCILAVGSVYKAYTTDPNMQPIAKNIMEVTLCCDHRVVDGATGAEWLRHFKSYIENPVTLLL